MRALQQIERRGKRKKVLSGKGADVGQNFVPCATCGQWSRRGRHEQCSQRPCAAAASCGPRSDDRGPQEECFARCTACGWRTTRPCLQNCVAYSIVQRRLIVLLLDSLLQHVHSCILLLVSLLSVGQQSTTNQFRSRGTSPPLRWSGAIHSRRLHRQEPFK